MSAPQSQRRNTWQVFDTPEPLLAWDVAFPLAADASHLDVDSSVDAVVADVVAAVVDSGLVVKASADDVQDELAVLEGRAPALEVRVGVRVGGAVVTQTCSDPGALWRRLEGPGFDPAYAERFAALGHPCVALWREVGEGRVDVAVAFFATVFFDEGYGDVFAHNQAQLRRTRAALEAVVHRRGGRLTAPLTLSPRQGDPG